VSFLVTSDHKSAGLLANALRATVQMPAFLMVALVTRWLQDESAEAMIGAIRDEAAARQKLAAAVLNGHTFSAHPSGHHIWVPLPRSWSRMEFTSHVQRQGLAIVTAETFSLEDVRTHAIRGSAVSSRYELVRSALKSSASATRII
jgi:DNA-binding transcriptional MocR family regulator